jgi:hypothetical protein
MPKIKTYDDYINELSKYSININSRYVKILTGKKAQVDLNTLVKEFNLFSELACGYIEIILKNEENKINEALEFFYNQTKGRGFFHLVGLTRSQVDLVTAFDEKLLVNKIDLKELPKILPSVFSVKFEKQINEKSALEAYGLSELR